MASQFRLSQDIPHCIPVPFKITWNIYNCCKVGNKLWMRNKVVELQSTPTCFACTGSSFHTGRRNYVPYTYLSEFNKYNTHMYILLFLPGCLITDVIKWEVLYQNLLTFSTVINRLKINDCRCWTVQLTDHDTYDHYAQYILEHMDCSFIRLPVKGITYTYLYNVVTLQTSIPYSEQV
jgi:hypothetical protein